MPKGERSRWCNPALRGTGQPSWREVKESTHCGHTPPLLHDVLLASAQRALDLRDQAGRKPRRLPSAAGHPAEPQAWGLLRTQGRGAEPVLPQAEGRGAYALAPTVPLLLYRAPARKRSAHTNQQQKTFHLKRNRPRLIDPKKQINTLANETPTAALPTPLTSQGVSPGLCVSPAAEMLAMPLPVWLGCPVQG